MNQKIKVKSPSNIAFVKYWGKRGVQLPLNPSISMTLKNSYTLMEVEFSKNKGELVDSLLFDRSLNQKFKDNIGKKLKLLLPEFPWLSSYSLKIKTKNSFPHSTGIASSASSMSALAFCLCLKHQELGHEFSYEFTSKIARLLSGSAARSLFSGFVTWGKESSEYASAFEDVHADFRNLKDAIILISSSSKKVSSTDGHLLFNTHPFKEARIKQANENFDLLLKAMKEGDFKLFHEIVFNEMMTLHALMMTSGYILMEPDSLKVLNNLISFKEKSTLPFTFTMDAGPNIHLIYPHFIQDEVHKYLRENIENSFKIIYDEVGERTSEVSFEF